MKKTIKKRFGLIGFPLTHSFSKKYFTEKFERENIPNHTYELFPLDTIEQFPELLKKHPDLVGLNVTIPYKEAVIPYLDELDESAAFGAVNTIRFEAGKLVGFNTDVYGFEHSLRPLLQAHHSTALILGTGGAAKAIAQVLMRLNIDFKYVSRRPKTGQFTYKDLDQKTLAQYPLIINTSPLGMYPNADACPDIPYPYLTDRHLLYDLVYNPTVTKFMKLGKIQGASMKNGLEMLYLQAEKAWTIWNTTDK